MRLRASMIALLVAMVLVGMFASSAIAMTNGAGNSATAPGQTRSEEECTKIWDEIQADLRTGGGPKSGPSIGPIGTYPGGSGPTNCDHFWQLQEAIGNS